MVFLAAAAPVLDTVGRVQSAGLLTCGVVAETDDWSPADAHGPLPGFDREICRAVAAAVLGGDPRTDIRPYPGETEVLDALQRHEVDLVAGVTPGVTASVTRNLHFGPVLFWDAAGLLIRGEVNPASPAGLAGKRVCFIDGTPTELLLEARHRDMIRLPFQEEGEMEDALAGGSCQAIAADVTRLEAIRQHLAPLRLVLVDDRSALDPLATAVRDGDARWSAVVDWTIHALILAEARGVTAANVRSLHAGDDPDLQVLLGTDWSSAAALGLPRDWPLRVLSTVGNYGEIYARSTALPRGVNALWLNGGLLAPLPLR